MGVYTGINAYKEIKGVPNNILILIPNYESYRGYVDLDDKWQGYPKFHYMLDLLEVDNYYEDNDENYNRFHRAYVKELTHMREVCDYADKIGYYTNPRVLEMKELFFTKRNTELAKVFCTALGKEECYFSEALTYNQLQIFLEKIADYMDISTVKDWSTRFFKEGYVFEVHVS